MTFPSGAKPGVAAKPFPPRQSGPVGIGIAEFAGLGQEGGPDLGPPEAIGGAREGEGGKTGTQNGPPLPRGQQGDGQEETQLGLVDKGPHQDSRQPGPTRQQYQSPAQEGGG